MALLAGAAFAQHVGAPTDDLAKLGVDELFSVQVTSVGRKAQELSKAPAAVFVLTAEDIRRSGATSLPEALRWVPGLTVLSSDDRSWLISARGSARLYADKILVMIDGRSLFTPLFSGVIWDAVDVPLGDIERIEVVRGPVAVMWGPNAVNGVINIITKSARQTRGARVAGAAGNSVHGLAESRWGDGSADERLSYRVWGKVESQNPAYGSPGVYYLARFAAWNPAITDLSATTGRFGFRADYDQSESSQWMVAGDIYKSGREEALGLPTVLPEMTFSQSHTGYAGGYLQAKWTHSSGGSETAVQFSYDRTRLNYPYLEGNLNNLTFDVQRRVQTGERNEVYFGVGYQQYWDDTASRTFAAFNPPSAAIRSGNVVLRDEFQIVPSRLMASAGIRLDYLSFGQLEYQPSFRLLYTPNARHSLWFAVSRAVRTPDRFDRNVRADYGFQSYAGIPIHELLVGSTAFRSETERSFEAGYRMQSGQRWSMDASLFWSRYGDLRVLGTGMPVPVVANGLFYLDVPATVANGGTGRSFGGEIWSTVQVRPGWRLTPGYSYVRDERWLPAGSLPEQYHWDREPSDLRHQGTLRSQHDLGRNWRVDLMARAHGRDRTFQLPGALIVDTRLAWQVTRSSEISFTCHNLAGREVLEAYAEGLQPSIPLRRTFLFQWAQKF
jgi:iron complex outermembrane receptor protein